MRLLSLLLLLANVGYALIPADTVTFLEGKRLASERSYQEAIPLLKESLNDGSLKKAYQGQVHYYMMKALWEGDQFDSSFAHGDSAIATFRALGDDYWWGHTLYSLCMNSLIAGSYEAALQQAQEAFDRFQEAQDTSMMIWSLGRRGIVFHDIGEYDEGIKVLQQANDLHALFSGKDADTQAMIWGITAINYDDRGDSRIAVDDYYRKILALEGELSSDRELVRTYNNMGNSLMKLGELDEAEELFLLNLAVNVEDGFRYGIATVKTNLGTIAYRRGNYQKAKKLLDDAEVLAFKINDTEKILDVLFQKYLMHQVFDQYEFSLDYLIKYHAVRDSLYDLDKQRQIRLLETQYETEKKEQQIVLQETQLEQQKAVLGRNRIALFLSLFALVLLAIVGSLWRARVKKQQQILFQQEKIHIKEAEINATISSQEKERARYARDLHDGFGQMISILKMNIGSLRQDAKPSERLKVFEESENVIGEMYDELKGICFDLMPQTLVNGGLQSGLEEFAERINKAGKVFLETNFFGLEERLQEVQEISLYRIAQEWINNILKYSDANKVTLQITKDQQEITLLIEDNGAGFDPSKLADSKGNGWKNLNARANLIKGNLELETVVGKKGNTLILNAPGVIQPVSEEKVST